MIELHPKIKLAGVLAPLFAIRGADDLGIGDTDALKELITWAARRGLRVVQILPVNETGSDCSPYNLLSAMALEPSTIATTPEALADLTPQACAKITARHDLPALRSGPVKYQKVKALKRKLLAAAFKEFRKRDTAKKRTRSLAKFEAEHAAWLPGYALHRALVSWHGESEVSTDWPPEHRSPDAARAWMEGLPAPDKKRMSRLVRFHTYTQWIAFSQWQSVREHAEREGVALMGDLPVGVSIFSSDVWLAPEIFDTAHSSGAPPEKVFKADPFTEKWGQNWGFPLYHWEAMAKNDYAWWRRRLQILMGVFHLLRADHALGFFRIYSFPWRPDCNAKFTDLSPEAARELTGGELPHFMDRDDETEENRACNQQHGERLFRMLQEETGPFRLIAEDLGEVAPYVRPTLQKLKIPGFKIPQWERIWDRLIPGKDYQRLSLAAYGTHDHSPLKAHWDELFVTAENENKATRDTAIHAMWELMDFCGCPDILLPQPFTPEIHEILLRGLLASNSWLAIAMITDIFGTTERFNIPGGLDNANWTQRMAEPIADWDIARKAPLAALSRSIAESGRLVLNPAVES